MPHYLFRHVPADLWLLAKARAAADHRSLREILIDLLRYYSRYGLPTNLKRHGRARARQRAGATEGSDRLARRW